MKPFDAVLRHDVTVGEQSDGRTRLTIKVPFRSVGAAIGSTEKDMEEPALLHASVTPPRRKIGAATWFLSQLNRCIHNEASVLMFLEAFSTALRSATFTLQKMCASIDGFGEWYAEKQTLMKDDPELRWIVDLRNVAEKEGVILAEYGPNTLLRHYRDGLVQAEAGSPSLNVAGVDVDDVGPHLESALQKIATLVEEAHDRFKLECPRSLPVRLEFLRENDNGTWEHFDPAK